MSGLGPWGYAISIFGLVGFSLFIYWKIRKLERLAQEVRYWKAKTRNMQVIAQLRKLEVEDVKNYLQQKDEIHRAVDAGDFDRALDLLGVRFADDGEE